jgi:hypothetical protein
MTDNTELDERLARLAARPRTRRRHPAALGRVFAAGLSTSGFLAIVTALASQQPASGVTTVATAPPRGVVTLPLGTSSVPPTTKPKAVETTVHHTVFVDKYGRPVAPSLVPATVGARRTSPATTHTAAATPSAHPAVGHPAPVSSSPPPTKTPTTSPATPHTSPPVTVHTPPPPPPPPHCSGSKCP